MRSSVCACVEAGSVYSRAARNCSDSFYVFKLPRTHIYLCTSGSRCPFSLRGKGQTQIFAEFGTLRLIDHLFGCYERPRKQGHICRGDTRRNSPAAKYPSTHVLGDRRNSEMFGDLMLCWHFD